jgi:hypothetical protein
MVMDMDNITTTNKNICACKDCTNIGTTILEVKYIQKVGYFCGPCTKALLKQGLAIRASGIIK